MTLLIAASTAFLPTRAAAACVIFIVGFVTTGIMVNDIQWLQDATWLGSGEGDSTLLDHIDFRVLIAWLLRRVVQGFLYCALPALLVTTQGEWSWSWVTLSGLSLTLLNVIISHTIQVTRDRYGAYAPYC